MSFQAQEAGIQFYMLAVQIVLPLVCSLCKTSALCVDVTTDIHYPLCLACISCRDTKLTPKLYACIPYVCTRYFWNITEGRVIAQAVSCWLCNLAAVVPSQVRLGGICGGQNVIAGFL
jgi:hypothetical protein